MLLESFLFLITTNKTKREKRNLGMVSLHLTKYTGISRIKCPSVLLRVVMIQQLANAVRLQQTHFLLVTLSNV